MSHTIHLGAAVADTDTTTAVLTGQIGAVQWNDKRDNHTEIRLYGPNEGNAVQEYCWQGGDPWTPGEVFAGSSLASRAAAAHWYLDKAAHVRVYYQDTSNNIAVKRYDTPYWTDGPVITDALPGTGLAALSFNDGTRQVLVYYYQTTSNQIVEQHEDASGSNQSGSKQGRVAFDGAAPGTGIAAIYYIDDSNSRHKRLYYQNTSGLIVEQCWDGNGWTPGQTFSDAIAGTGIAATHWWNSGSHLRLYYQNAQDKIVEKCYNTGAGWTTGHTFTQVASSTGVAAVGWHDSLNHVRLYYKDAAPYDGTYHAVIEQCYDDGLWTRGAFIARAA